MKRKYALFVLFLSLWFVNTARAGERTFSINFELTDILMNRALVTQFNDPSFLYKTITGTVNIPNEGTAAYQIALARPVISFTTDKVIIALNFTFHGAIGSKSFDYTFSGSPTISVPTSTISSTQIEATLNNFEEVLTVLVNNNIIPSWLKTLVYEHYKTFKPYLMLSPLMGLINDSDFMKERPISLTEILLTNSVQNNKLILTITAKLLSEQTHFYLKFVFDQYYADKIDINTNIMCTMEELWIWVEKREVFHKSNIGFKCQPNVNNRYYLGDDYLSYGMHTAAIVFKTSSTYYLKQWDICAPNNFKEATSGINY